MSYLQSQRNLILSGGIELSMRQLQVFEETMEEVRMDRISESGFHDNDDSEQKHDINPDDAKNGDVPSSMSDNGEELNGDIGDTEKFEQGSAVSSIEQRLPAENPSRDSQELPQESKEQDDDYESEQDDKSNE
jgi:hypothetical protein